MFLRLIWYREGGELLEHHWYNYDRTVECKTASNTHDIKVQEGKRRRRKEEKKKRIEKDVETCYVYALIPACQPQGTEKEHHATPTPYITPLYMAV